MNGNTYTSRQELIDLPTGTRIIENSRSNGQRTWTKSGDDNWTSDAGRSVRTEAFDGTLAAGRCLVWEEPLPVVGAMWQTPDGTRFIICHAERDGDGMSIDWFKVNNDEVPLEFFFDQKSLPEGAAIRANASSYRSWHIPIAKMMSERLRENYTSMSTMDAYKAGLQHDLHAYLTSIDAEVDSPLEQIMHDHGMERRYRPVPTVIEAKGMLIAAVSPEQQANIIQTDVSIDADTDMQVAWAKTIETEVMAPSCGCAKVTDELVSELLGFEYTAMAWTATCSDDACVSKSDESSEETAEAEGPVAFPLAG